MSSPAPRPSAGEEAAATTSNGATAASASTAAAPGDDASSPSSAAAAAPTAAASSSSSSAAPSASASSSSAAPHIHDVYSSAHCPRPPSCHPKIDMHTHILPEHLPDLSKRYGYGNWVSLQPSGSHSCCAHMFKGKSFFRTVEENCFRAEARIRDMDAQHINVQVLSTVPVMFNYAAKPEDTLDLARYLNDHISGVVKQHPTRFVGLGTIPMQSVEHAIPELRRCILELGLVGVQIGSHINDMMLGDAKLAPIFEEAERLGACIFIHPWDMTGEALMNKFWLPWLVGMPMETAMAICSLMLSGLLGRLPNLRIMFAHGGGSFPGTIGRIEHGWHCRPDLVAIDTPGRSPRSWLGSFWLDSLVHDPQALHQIVSLVGEDRVALGTDYPFPLGEIHMGSLIEHMDHSQLPPEHGGISAPDQPSPLHPSDRALWTRERKNKLLWRNALEFLGLDHAEEKFLIRWEEQRQHHYHRRIKEGDKAAGEVSQMASTMGQLSLEPPAAAAAGPTAASSSSSGGGAHNVAVANPSVP